MPEAPNDSAGYYEIYDLLHASKDYDAEVARVLDTATHVLGAPPQRVLDVGCGTGGHSLAFAARGLTVVACDLEAPAIERARARAEAAGARGVTFIRGDAAVIEPTGTPLAVAMFNVVNYLLTRDALDAFFAAIARHQTPGGALIFDGWNGVAALRDAPRAEVRTMESPLGRLQVDLRPEFDPMRERVTLDLSTVWSVPGREDRPMHFRYHHRAWTPEAVRESLAASGYRLEAIERLATPGEPAGPDDWKVLFVARRA